MAKDKILIVDDNPMNLKLLDKMLTKSGFEVLFAQNGKEACEVAVKQKPDIVLLDIIMPVMDGFDTCTWLKKNKATSNIPVVFFVCQK